MLLVMLKSSLWLFGRSMRTFLMTTIYTDALFQQIHGLKNSGNIKNRLPSETMHAILQLYSILTRTHSIIFFIFLDEWGLPMLPPLPTSTPLSGFDNVAADIIRYIPEVPRYKDHQRSWSGCEDKSLQVYTKLKTLIQWPVAVDIFFRTWYIGFYIKWRQNKRINSVVVWRGEEVDNYRSLNYSGSVSQDKKLPHFRLYSLEEIILMNVESFIVLQDRTMKKLLKG